MKDYSSYSDEHASYRDKKREKKLTEKLMRGNRSVFEMEKSIVKRSKQTRKPT